MQSAVGNGLLGQAFREESQSDKKDGNIVTLYRIIPKETVDVVTREGIRLESNKREDFATDMEKIFQEEGKKRGVGIDRTNCIYAFPRDPRQEMLGLGFDELTQEIVEIQVNLKTTGAIVADGEKFTEAAVDLKRGDEESARNWAGAYWEEAMTLEDYVKAQKGSPGEIFIDFQMPEVLIPEDIPAENVRLAKRLADAGVKLDQDD